MKNSPVLEVVLVILTLLTTGCTSPKVESIRNDPLVYAPSPTPIATNSISIKDGRFSPQVIEIGLGETLVLTNLDNARHLVVSDPHPEHDQLPDFYSDYLIENEDYSYTFKATGAFGIHLENNPSVSAKIIVR